MDIRQIIAKFALAYIRKADDLEIQEVIHAILHRYKARYPDWEISFLALPKHDPEARKNALLSLISFLERHD